MVCKNSRPYGRIRSEFKTRKHVLDRIHTTNNRFAHKTNNYYYDEEILSVLAGKGVGLFL